MRIDVKRNELKIHYPNLKYGKLLQTFLKNLELSEEEAVKFIESEKSQLEDPFKIFGMEKAVEVIENAIEDKKKIAIHGDFDVDGVCATAIIWDYLYYERKIECLPVIPHRVDEGYGLSEKTLKRALDFGADLIITVDCGVKDAVLVEKYKDRLDFVITDHHQFTTDDKGEIILPDAKSVVHSIHPDSKFPTMISGAATAWQLVRALEMNRFKDKSELRDSMSDLTQKYLDLVAISTVCDIIPLTIENRKLIQKGLKQIAKNERLGLDELFKITALKPSEVSCYHCGFVIGPRLNAPGRVQNDAIDALRLLATRNNQQAIELSQKLQNLNTKRQELTSTYIAIAEKQIDLNKKAIVILGEEWPEGILGLIAGKLAEKHYRPVFVGSKDHSGKITGSSRSPLQSFYLNKALDYAKDSLTRYGGHKQAAGFASHIDIFTGFESKVLEFINANTSEEDFLPIVSVDLELKTLSGITVEDIEELNLLEPHGLGNQRPLFLLKDCKVVNYNKIGKEANHLKLQVNIDGKDLDGIGFNMAEKYNELFVGQAIDIIGHLGINEWNNKKKIQVEMKQILVA